MVAARQPLRGVRVPAYDPPTQLREPARVPTRLGKYDLREPVGHGSSGTVYDAWDPDLARRVAIKRVQLLGRPEDEQRELRARFRQEAQIAGRLSHPGVVSVYDYGEQDGAAYLVMEFIEGESLAVVLQGMRQRHETMTPDRAVAIVHGMLQALAACHRAGVLHRDIKPGNVMVSRDGAVKLTDFGVARTATSDLTLQGTLLGTPAYMSPELFETGAVVDNRSDVYACGVVLYELLTGRKPFEGDLFAVMHQVRTELPVPPSRAGAAVPAALDAVVLQAMAKQPENRFADAEAFDERLMGGPSPVSRMRRARAWVVAGLLATAAGGAAGWYVLGPDAPAPVAATSPPVEPAAVVASVAGALPDVDPNLLPALGRLPCAAIVATAQRDPPLLRLRGLIGEATERDGLAPLLAGYRGDVWRDGLQTFPDTGALCEVAALLRAVAPDSLRLILADGRPRLTEGDAIRLTLQMPEFAGDVRLDYVTDGGRLVVHLEPGSAGTRRWPAAARVALGPAGDGVIGSVGEPYGTDMIVVTVAEQDVLPAARSEQEPAAPYLRALQAAMAEAVARGQHVAADAVVLETAAR